VTVLFTARHGHQLITDVRPEDLDLKDDHKKPKEIVALHSQADLPLRLGMLLDVSGSVQSRVKFERQETVRFLDQVLDSSRDMAFVSTFEDAFHVVHDFSSDRSALDSAISHLKAGGGTALWDSVREACRRLGMAPDANSGATRVLVILTDGDDNASKGTLQDAVTAAQQYEVTVYVLDVNDGDGKAVAALKQLALQTGGQLFFPSGRKSLDKTFSRVRDEIRHQYALSYIPSDFAANGRFRRIELRILRAGQALRVRARRGYYAFPLAAVDGR
jgi:VWFA-related protein